MLHWAAVLIAIIVGLVLFLRHRSKLHVYVVVMVLQAYVLYNTSEKLVAIGPLMTLVGLIRTSEKDLR